jgi:hypothetical protein
MAEAAKQFFVGFLHPRTWLAAIIALVVAALVGWAISGTVMSNLSFISSNLNSATLKGSALGLFEGMFLIYDAAVGGQYTPLITVIASGAIAGIIFGFTAKKERVASKSIIGGLDIAIIYLVIVVISFIIWTLGLGSLYSNVVSVLQSVPADILLVLIVVWWVSAIFSMIVLSMKHD